MKSSSITLETESVVQEPSEMNTWQAISTMISREQ